jgi:hypothetical protein
MTNVPICIFEDTSIPHGRTIKDLLQFPRTEVAGGETYVFDWSKDFDPTAQLGVYEPRNLLNNRDPWLSAANSLREMNGPVIIFLDIHHQTNNGVNIDIRPSDFENDVVIATMPLCGTSTNAGELLQWANPSRLGLLLAVHAATNCALSGIITFASQRTDVSSWIAYLTTLSEDRVVWRELGYSLTGTTPERLANIINTAIQLFLAKREGPPIWS